MEQIYQLITNKGNFQVAALNQREAVIKLAETTKNVDVIYCGLEFIYNLDYNEIKLLFFRGFTTDEVKLINRSMEVLKR